MTIASTVTHNELAGTVGVFGYAFTFRCDTASWVKVYLDDVLQSSGYSVALNVSQVTSPGGTVTFDAAPAGKTVLIRRVIPLVQELDLQDYSAFPAGSLEASLDLAVMQAQDLNRDLGDAVDRALPPYDLAAAVEAAQVARAGSEDAEAGSQAARVGAETARAGAEAAQDGADAAQTGAEVAQAGAESAATAALAASRTFIDTTAGLAATGSGDVFLVVTADPQVFSVYQNDGGAAVPLGTLVVQGTELTEGRLLDYAGVGHALSLVDGRGNVAAGVADDGTFVAEELAAAVATIDTLNGAPGDGVAAAGEAAVRYAPPGYAWALVDTKGNAAFGVKDDGTLATGSLEVDDMAIAALAVLELTDVESINGVPVDTANDVVQEQVKFQADINLILTDGQSLSMGNTSVPVISTTQPYDSLRFNGSVRSFNVAAGSRYGSLVPLTETQDTGSPRYPTITLGETPSSGTGLAAKQLIASEDGLAYTDHAYQLLFSADGDGTALSTFLEPSSPEYVRITESIQAGFDLAMAGGKSFNVPAITWSHGETDYQSGTTLAAYRDGMEQLRAAVDATAKGVTGQLNDVVMIAYQIAAHKFYSRAYPNLALAQAEAAETYRHIYLACPMYQFTYTDGVHIDATSAKRLGAYYGIVYKRVVVDKQNWRPLMPVAFTKQGAILTIQFHVPAGKLVLDTSLVSANTDYGFSLFDSGGTPITISSVTVTGPNTVKIVAGSAIPAGAKVQYAFYGAGTSGRTTGPRGNLRDQQGDTIIIEPAGMNFAAHNWCIMFEEIL